MKKRSKTQEVLNIIGGVTEGFRRSFPSYDYDELMAVRNLKELRGRKQALERLKTQDLITTRMRGSKIWLDLTERGEQFVLAEIIRCKSRLLPKGRVCVVCFDIPESIKEVRQALRKLLREAKLRHIQRSVWEGRRDIVNELRELVRRNSAQDWIRVYVADELSK
ncbi:MAG: hypothetical protein AAB429_00680 [Patescibacteria group bacterium]